LGAVKLAYIKLACNCWFIWLTNFTEYFSLL